MEVTVVFMGDSLMTGVLSDNKIHKDFLGFRGLVSGVVKNNYSFSVPGHKIIDLKNQIETNIDLISVNKLNLNNEIVEANNISKNDIFPIDGDNINILDALKNSEVLMVSVGGNDIATSFEYKNGKILNFDISKSRKALLKARDEKIEFFKLIKSINPNIKIIDVALYYPFLHDATENVVEFKKFFSEFDEKLFINDIENNIVKVNNNAIESELILDNPQSVHPCKRGHHLIFQNVVNDLF